MELLDPAGDGWSLGIAMLVYTITRSYVATGKKAQDHLGVETRLSDSIPVSTSIPYKCYGYRASATSRPLYPFLKVNENVLI